MTTVSTYAQAPAVGVGANGHQGVEVGPDGALWATLNAQGAGDVGLYRIDPATRAYQLVAGSLVGPEVFTLAPGGAYWVLSSVQSGTGNVLLRIRLSDGDVTVIPDTTGGGKAPVAPSFRPSNGDLYWMNYNTGVLHRRPNYMSATGETTVATGVAGVEDLFFASDDTCWVCQYGPGYPSALRQLNPSTGAVLATWSGPSGPEGVAELDGDLYVVSRPDASVWKLDRSAGTYTRIIGAAGVGYQDGDAAVAKFEYPSVIVADEGRLYIGEIAPSRRMRQVDVNDPGSGWHVDLVMP